MLKHMPSPRVYARPFVCYGKQPYSFPRSVLLNSSCRCLTYLNKGGVEENATLHIVHAFRVREICVHKFLPLFLAVKPSVAETATVRLGCSEMTHGESPNAPRFAP